MPTHQTPGGLLTPLSDRRDPAGDIYESIEGIKEVYVFLLSRIGAPVDRPQLATAQLVLERGRRINEIASTVETIFQREFAALNGFCAALARGEYPVC